MNAKSGTEKPNTKIGVRTNRNLTSSYPNSDCQEHRIRNLTRLFEISLALPEDSVSDLQIINRTNRKTYINDA